MSRAAEYFREEIQYVQGQINFCRDQSEFYRALGVRLRRRQNSERSYELSRLAASSFLQEVVERQEELNRLLTAQADHFASAAEDHQT